MSERKRILVVGGVAGGASFAARMRRLDEDAEIVIYEKGPHVSFANCGLPYYVGGVIEEEASLLVASPEKFRTWFNIDVKTRHEVTAVDKTANTIVVRDLSTGDTFTDEYTHLILSPGAEPIRPPLPGIDNPEIFTVRNVPDATGVRKWIEDRGAQRAVLVGGGYIGLEMMENLVEQGLHCTVIELADQVMAPADKELMVPIHEEILRRGVDLRLGTKVMGFVSGDDGLTVQAEGPGGGDFPADVVILAIGVRPLVKLAADADLELGKRGGISVDAQMRTSHPNIFAIGDAVEVVDYVTGTETLIPLAGPANRQGRLVADAIAGRDVAFRGVQGTAVCGVFDSTIAMTGLTEKAARRAGIEYEKVYLNPGHHVGYYPGAEPIFIKMLFDPDDGRVLGAQAVGKAGVEKRIDVIATFIQMKATVYDLEEAELCYAPQYGSAKDPVNMAGFIAANHLRGDAPLAHFKDLVDGAAPDDVVVLDVRTLKEFDAGHIDGAQHVPLQELRERLDEVPRDRPVWVHCGVGIRSHNATRILRQAGVQAFNLSGGWWQRGIAEKAFR